MLLCEKLEKRKVAHATNGTDFPDIRSCRNIWKFPVRSNKLCNIKQVEHCFKQSKFILLNSALNWEGSLEMYRWKLFVWDIWSCELFSGISLSAMTYKKTNVLYQRRPLFSVSSTLNRERVTCAFRLKNPNVISRHCNMDLNVTWFWSQLKAMHSFP